MNEDEQELDARIDAVLDVYIEWIQEAHIRINREFPNVEDVGLALIGHVQASVRTPQQRLQLLQALSADDDLPLSDSATPTKRLLNLLKEVPPEEAANRITAIAENPILWTRLQSLNYAEAKQLADIEQHTGTLSEAEISAINTATTAAKTSQRAKRV